MAASVPQDYSFLQKRRVRARVLSLSFVATMLIGLVTMPYWSVYGRGLPPELIQAMLFLTFLCFLLSVFFFGVALKYVKLQIHLSAPLRIQREGLVKSLKRSRVRLIIWILLLLSPLFAALVAISMATLDRSSALVMVFAIAFTTPILTVCGLFGSALEFNNNRALRIMLAWASTEISAETQYLNH